MTRLSLADSFIPGAAGLHPVNLPDGPEMRCSIREGLTVVPVIRLS
jgi:hypothetical protein